MKNIGHDDVQGLVLDHLKSGCGVPLCLHFGAGWGVQLLLSEVLVQAGVKYLVFNLGLMTPADLAPLKTNPRPTGHDGHHVPNDMSVVVDYNAVHIDTRIAADAIVAKAERRYIVLNPPETSPGIHVAVSP